MDTDIIGGFPCAEPNCKGCGRPLILENAWMADGCPCNHALGINSMNETRWRLLMQLQQQTRSECAMAEQQLRATTDGVIAALLQSERIAMRRAERERDSQYVPAGHHVVDDTDGQRFVKSVPPGPPNPPKGKHPREFG